MPAVHHRLVPRGKTSAVLGRLELAGLGLIFGLLGMWHAFAPIVGFLLSCPKLDAVTIAMHVLRAGELVFAGLMVDFLIGAISIVIAVACVLELVQTLPRRHGKVGPKGGQPAAASSPSTPGRTTYTPST